MSVWSSGSFPRNHPGMWKIYMIVIACPGGQAHSFPHLGCTFDERLGLLTTNVIAELLGRGLEEIG